MYLIDDFVHRNASVIEKIVKVDMNLDLDFKKVFGADEVQIDNFS